MAARKEGWCKYIPVGTKGMLVCHAKVTGPDNGQVIGNIFNSGDAEPRLNVCFPYQVSVTVVELVITIADEFPDRGPL
jgi:hypothetical protein